MARPIGSVETADGILRKEMIEWAKVHKRLRSLLETEVTYFENLATNNTTDMAGHLQIMQALRELMATSSRVLEGGFKIIRDESGQGKTPTGEDPDTIYDELMKGKDI